MKFSVITLTFNQQPFLAEKVKPAWERQTFKDFEWVLANDGSTDGTKDWAVKNHIDIFSKEKNTGFDLVGCLNAAAKICTGKYLVWVMGDTYPREDFLEQLNKAVAADRMVCGVRMNVDKVTGEIISRDWRLDQVVSRKLFKLDQDIVKVDYSKPWELMTLNGMCMSRAAWDKMGGIYGLYSAYGQMDSDMAAWCLYHGIGLYWAMEAVLYHLYHSDRPDDIRNQNLLHTRIKMFQKEALKGGDN